MGRRNDEEMSEEAAIVFSLQPKPKLSRGCLCFILLQSKPVGPPQEELVVVPCGCRASVTYGFQADSSLRFE